MKKIKIIFLVALFGGAVWVLSGGVSVSKEKATPKALWNAIAGNDPDHKSDEDKDGLSYEEEKKHGTDPKKADTDGDGFRDGQEVKGGFDPLRAAPGDNQAQNSLNQNQNAGANNPVVVSGDGHAQTNNNTNAPISFTPPLASQKNMKAEVQIKVDDLMRKYNFFSGSLDTLPAEDQASLEKEVDAFIGEMLKSSGLDFAFNVPDSVLRVNAEEQKTLPEYLLIVKQTLKEKGLLDENQTIEEGLKENIAELSGMSKKDIDWDKTAIWRKSAAEAYEKILAVTVNSQYQEAHVRLLRALKSLGVVLENIDSSDYFRAYLAAGRAEKINEEIDKFTEEVGKK